MAQGYDKPFAQRFSYGKAASRGNQGQGMSRFEIGGDPSPYIPVWAAGGFQASPPGYLILDGGPYRYGDIHINSLVNLVSDGAVCRPLMVSEVDLSGSGITLTLGAGGLAVESIVTAQPSYSRPIPFENNVTSVDVNFLNNGEFAYRTTGTVLDSYGAIGERFTGDNVGAAVVPGAGNVVNVGGGPVFAAVVLTGPYGYVPAFNNPQVGDIVELLVGAVASFHRVTSLTVVAGNLTQIGIFPNKAAGAQTAYHFIRTGYGSYTHPQLILNNQDIYFYYAGNVRNLATARGRLQCVKVNGFGPPFVYQHFMAPDAGAIFGTTAATDCIYFKGFLLYGAGNSIAWSVAGFPTNYATGFGATDFPAINISPQNASGTFLYFQRIGDQVYAFFSDGVFLCTTTGVVPEFNFTRLPDSSGALLASVDDPEIPQQPLQPNQLYGRSMTEGRGNIWFQAKAGAKALAGQVAERFSKPIEPATTLFRPQYAYANELDFLLISRSDTASAFMFTPETEHFNLVDFSQLPSMIYGLAPGSYFANNLNRTPRRIGLGWWRNNRVRLINNFPDEFEVDDPSTSSCQWYWATPIISLSDMYEGFQYGGFRPLIRPAEGSGSPVNLTWTMYAGNSPMNMQIVQGPDTFNYENGAPGSREMISTKHDDAYIGFTFSGFRWCELAGVALYDIATKSRR